MTLVLVSLTEGPGDLKSQENPGGLEGLEGMEDPMGPEGLEVLLGWRFRRYPRI